MEKNMILENFTCIFLSCFFPPQYCHHLIFLTHVYLSRGLYRSASDWYFPLMLFHLCMLKKSTQLADKALTVIKSMAQRTFGALALASDYNFILYLSTLAPTPALQIMYILQHLLSWWLNLRILNYAGTVVVAASMHQFQLFSHEWLR